MNLPVFGPTGVQNIHDDAPVPFVIVRVDYQLSREELLAALVLGFTETDPDRDPAGLSSENVHQLVESALAGASGLELTKFEEHLRTGEFSAEQMRRHAALARAADRAYRTVPTLDQEAGR